MFEVRISGKSASELHHNVKSYYEALASTPTSPAILAEDVGSETATVQPEVQSPPQTKKQKPSVAPTPPPVVAEVVEEPVAAAEAVVEVTVDDCKKVIKDAADKLGAKVVLPKVKMLLERYKAESTVNLEPQDRALFVRDVNLFVVQSSK